MRIQAEEMAWRTEEYPAPSSPRSWVCFLLQVCPSLVQGLVSLITFRSLFSEACRGSETRCTQDPTLVFHKHQLLLLELFSVKQENQVVQGVGHEPAKCLSLNCLTIYIDPRSHVRPPTGPCALPAANSANSNCPQPCPCLSLSSP